YGLAEAFCHVGGYFTYVASNQVDIKLGVINGWDRLIDNNKDKTIIGRLGVNLGDPLAFGISGSWGVEQPEPINDARTSLDLTGITKVIPKVALNFQVNYGSETIETIDTTFDATWAGFGIQPVISLSDNVDLGARIEYFSDPEGVRTGTSIKDFNSLNVTLVPTFKWDGFVFRIEYRLDNASDKIFPVNGKAPSKTSNTVSLGVSCNF
ncbi:MAG TPA: outer membrane beta-barrel protein, partial [Ignavibacteriaceae bacterium]|nr:outer membrane beta-barrel protein [Ignavibacteriaceae bacterium]